MLHSAKNDDHLDKVRKLAKSAGYSTGGQNHSMKKIAKKEADAAVHAHEKHEHGGKLTKLKSGGVAEGKESKHRLDKHARGGKTKGSHVHVNVIVPQGKQGMPPMAPPMPQAGAPMGASPPRAPMAPPAPGGPPGGMANVSARPPGMKTGGKVLDGAGSGSGEGRENKAKAYGWTKKKKGGKVLDGEEPEGGTICSKDGGTCVE